jgi:hypothetical protein
VNQRPNVNPGKVILSKQTRREGGPASEGADARIVEMKLAGEHPLIVRLEELMGELVVTYEQMKTMGEMRLDAIKSADAHRLAACVRQENELVQRVADLEKQRITVVGGIASELGSPKKHETTIGWIAGRVDGAKSSALSSAAERLRALMGEVMKMNAVAKGAAERLARHMEGLMHEIARGLNHAQVYGRNGRVGATARVVSGLDIKS